MDVEQHMKGLASLAAARGLGLLVIFGSRARGVSRPGSDLDLGVQRRDGRRMGWREMCALCAVFADSAGSEVDVVDLAAADPLMRLEVIGEGRVLHEAEPGLWSSLVARTLIERDDLGPLLDACVAGVGRALRAAGDR